MRILHIDSGREMRGGQHQVLLLLRKLRDKGHASVLLCRPGSPLWNAAVSAGFEVAPASLSETWSRSKLADVVHVHDARSHTLAAIASGTKFVVSRRVAFPVNLSFFSRWKYRRAARYLAVSEFVAARLAAAHVPNEDVDVVYDGVEPRESITDWNPDLPIVALASADPAKGRDLVSLAANLVGVKIAFSEDLLRDLRHCAAFVYITRSEGLGSAALLAMSMGVPVIASRVEGLSEVFVHDTSGIYVENEPASIAAAVQRLLRDPVLANRIRHAGKARVAQQFTDEQLVENTVRVYERALAG